MAQQHQSPLGPGKCRPKPTPGLLDPLLHFNKIPEDLRAHSHLRSVGVGPGCLSSLSWLSMAGDLPFPGSRRQWGKGGAASDPQKRWEMLPRGPPSRGTGAPAARAACLLPAPTSVVQGTYRDWGLCHHPANSLRGQANGTSSAPRHVSHQPPPIQAGETEAVGPAGW